MDVGFFAGADAGACGLDGLALEVGVQGQVVETAVCETVSIICLTRQQDIFFKSSLPIFNCRKTLCECGTDISHS